MARFSTKTTFSILFSGEFTMTEKMLCVEGSGLRRGLEHPWSLRHGTHQPPEQQ